MRLKITTQVLQLIRHASSLFAHAHDFGRDFAELVKLEAKLAVGSAISMALLGVVVLLLLFTGWILLISSLVARLAEDWRNLPGALLVVGLISIAAALPLIFMIKQQSGNLGFKATRRQLGIAHDTIVTQPSQSD
jgi:TRAP-type uncharacterized transport system fused permease subunit